MSSHTSSPVDHNPGKGRPGRPAVSQQERIGRIIQAAEQVFVAKSYGAATMEEIARTAGMSKKSLYELYPDKRHVLAAVIVAAHDFPWADIDATPAADPLTELRHRLIAVIEFVLSPRQVRLTRILISEAEQAPQLVDEFYERVMAKGQAYLASAVMRLGHEQLDSGLVDIRQLTGALFGVAMGDLHLQALFGKASGLTRKLMLQRINLALRMCGFII
ncbi:TetR/AcrR family transcriptional regulator [Pleomorphomonas carboxyditropha]|uniref:HTH tetR-type domain-containing protein n=1 Tax=Pleomorphomonas carboxyditropha TaxID=2023338 RepID=A0A2G9WXU0_9HYPH|nr:TetR/AcrR family transcriptional regulator [Pleomorphomonas carboxyditropha]PIO99489.1 hypothetical protein CJ014_09240 [Pleomorphomonas carboxyditropha]